MNTLAKRTVSGIVYIAVMLTGLLIHPLIFALVFSILLFFTQREFYKLIENENVSPQKITGLVLGVIFFLICFASGYGLIPSQSYMLIFPGLIIIFLVEIFSKKPDIIQNSAVTIAGFIYIAVPLSLMNFIVFPADSVFYPWTLLGIFFVIWIYDTTAYLAGSWFGRHKIYEKISPDKTWEGLIAGSVFAVIMGIINAVIFQTTDIGSWIFLAAIIIIFGTFGDFFESKFKRSLSLKDSGKIIPGHGGFLDRLDSLLFILPVVFVWLIFYGNI